MKQKYFKLSSAAHVIGDLRVNFGPTLLQYWIIFTNTRKQKFRDTLSFTWMFGVG